MFRMAVGLAVMAVLLAAGASSANAQAPLPEIFVEPPLSGDPRSIVFDDQEARILMSDSRGMILVRQTSDWSVVARLGMALQGYERSAWYRDFASLSPDGKRVITVAHRLVKPKAAIFYVDGADSQLPQETYLKPADLGEDYEASWPEVSADFKWLLVRFSDFPSGSRSYAEKGADVFVAYSIEGDRILPAPAGTFETRDQKGERVVIADGAWSRDSTWSEELAFKAEMKQLAGELGLSPPLETWPNGPCQSEVSTDPVSALFVTEDGRLVLRRRANVTTTNLIPMLQVQGETLGRSAILLCSKSGTASWFLYSSYKERQPESDLWAEADWWPSGDLNILKIDHGTGAVSLVSRHSSVPTFSFKIGPKDSLLLIYDTRIFLYDSAGKERKFMSSGGGISRLSYSSAGRRLSVGPTIPFSVDSAEIRGWFKGRVRILDFSEGGQIWAGPESDCGISGGLILVCENSRASISRWFRSVFRPADMKTFQLDEALLGGRLQDTVTFADTPLQASADGAKLLVRSLEESEDESKPVVMRLVDLVRGSNQKLLYDKTYSDFGNEMYGKFDYFFTDDLARHLRIGENGGPDNRIALVDTVTGNRLAEWQHREEGEASRFIALNPAGTQVLYRTYDRKTGADEKLLLRNTDGTGLREISLPAGQSLIRYVWRPQGDVLYTGQSSGSGKVLFRTLDAGSMRQLGAVDLCTDGPPTEYEFLDADRVAVGTSLGAVHIFDLKTGREQVRYYAAGDDEWIAITPEGYFTSSSPAAEELLKVRINGKETGIGQYRERFFRPDIVQMAMNGQALPASLTTLADAAPPPRIKALTAGPVSAEGQVSLSYQIEDAGGGVGGIRLYNNDTAVLELAPSEVGAGSQKLTLRLKAGENRLRLIAFSRNGDVSSEPVSLVLDWRGGTSHGTTLHVLAIGIEEFRNPVLNLAYPAQDARVLAATLRDRAGGLFDRVEVKVLTSPEETTRAAILAAFRQYQAISPDDAFVFYVASHGSVEGADIEDREFMLYTSNVGLLSSEALRAEAISQEDIKAFISNVPATRKLILLDTCHAGAIGDSLAAQTRGVEEAGAIKALSRITGTTILSASMAQQQAIEGYNGHGLFTWVLLEALNGKAAIAGSDRVSNWNITSYVGRIVPEIAKARFGREQFPTVNDAGRQFDLVMLQPEAGTSR